MDGSIFVTGWTTSDEFPVTPNALQATMLGCVDAFVTHIRPDGSLGYSTYLGGLKEDGGSSIALGPQSTVYIAGLTSSLDFPTTPGAFKQTQPPAPGYWFTFAAKLDLTAATAVYATYLEGNEFPAMGDTLTNHGSAPSIAVDSVGNAYVAGTTPSRDFPTTAGSFDRTHNGRDDVFVVKLNLAGSRLLYSTFLGSAWDDSPTGIAIDAERNVYLTGYAIRGFPVTETLFDPGATAFVTKLDSAGANLVFSFLFGGAQTPTNSGHDFSTGITLYVNGTIYIAGGTSKTNFPTTPDAFQTVPYSISQGTNRFGFIAKFRPLLAAPPTELMARALSTTQIRLTWKDGSNNETGFALYRRSEDGEFSQVGIIPANRTNYTDSGLRPATSYIYHLRANTRDGTSATSNEAAATTLPLPPAAPTDLAVTAVSHSALQLSWRDRSTNEFGFRLERRLDGGAFARVTDVSANETTYQDEGLRSNTRYTYRLKARNLGGDSPYSNEAPGLTRPAPPTALRATVGGSQKVTLAWIAAIGGADLYRLERRRGEGAFQRLTDVTAPTTTHLDETVQPATTYTYRVKAVNASGESLPSNEATAITLLDPPAAPTNLAVTPLTSRSVKLAWRDNSTNEAEFRLQWRQPDGTFRQFATTAPNVITFTTTSLQPETRNTFRVLAANAGGVSAPAEGSGTTFPAPPNPPSDLTVTALSAASLKLTWRDQSANESGFRIERQVGSGAFAPLGAVGANVVTHTDSGLRANTRYGYRVKAWNAGGEAVPTSVVPGLTLPLAPTNLQATANGRTATLTWQQDVSGAAGFQLERQAGGAAFREVARPGGTLRTYQDGSLAPNATYTYRLRAFNASGYSPYSSTAVVTTTVRLISLVVQPASLKGGKKAWGTVTLDGPAPTGGARIALTSNLGAVRVPSSVTVPANSTSARFRVTTKKVKARKQATLSATYGGVTKTAVVTVRR
jgi:hypothetical protein